MSMAALGCVKSDDATAGPRPFGTAGAAGMESAGTVMPAGGLADGERTVPPGRGGNAELDLAVAGAAAAGAGAGDATTAFTA
jgi:hypothetical protein